MQALYAGVAELADALDLGSSAFRRAGSIPVTRTNLINQAHVEWSRELFDYVALARGALSSFFSKK